MASVKLSSMLDIGLDKALSEMSIRQKNTALGKPDLSTLLPVKYTMGIGQYYSSVTFKNPMSKEEFDIPYSNEVGRVNATMNINAEIKKYNDEVEQLNKKLDKEIGIERRIVEQRYQQIKERSLWRYNVWCEKAQHINHWDDAYKNQVAHIDVRRFENEELYKSLQSIPNDEERVIRLNRLIYDYLKAVTEGETLVESSSLYYPLLEFSDYFMRMPSNKSFVSLLSQKHTLVVDNRPSPFEGFLYHNSNGGKTGDGRTKEISNEDFVIAHHYKLVITLSQTNSKGTLHIEKPYKREGNKYKLKDWAHRHLNQRYYDNKEGRDVSGSLTFSDAGFKEPKKGINKFIKLLMAHAHFQKRLKDAHDRNDEEIISSYAISIKKELPNDNTETKYHSELRKILTNMLNLSQIGLDVIKFRSIDFQNMTHQGVAETIKHRIYELQLPIEVHHVKDSKDMGGIHRDIMDDYMNQS